VDGSKRDTCLLLVAPTLWVRGGGRGGELYGSTGRNTKGARRKGGEEAALGAMYNKGEFDLGARGEHEMWRCGHDV
jgi:hypothetical protein